MGCSNLHMLLIGSSIASQEISLVASVFSDSSIPSIPSILSIQFFIEVLPVFRVLPLLETLTLFTCNIHYYIQNHHGYAK